jgi:rod shape determining protein RodA
MSSSFGSASHLSLAEKLWRLNWPVLIAATAIAALGTAALYSVAGGSFQPWAERHALRFLLSAGLVIAMAMVRPEVWLRLAFPVYLIALVMLALVPYVGLNAMGARRWIGFGSLSFQPSELMKLALVAALARYYQWLTLDRVGQPRWVLIALLMIAIPVVLTLRQPDLGTGLLFALVGLSMMFMAGTPLIYFAGGLGAALAAAPLVWSHLHDYQRRRVEIFLNPEMDPFGSGYHITQSKIAIGSGGMWGKGFVQGSQSQLDFVPEKQTDFIFAMIGEEWGFAGFLVLLGLYVVLLALMLRMALRTRSTFARLLIAGSASVLFVYVFINIAMVTGLVPVVGVPLPLVSYGGTSMITLMVSLGLAMSADLHGQDAIRRDEMGPFL